MSLHLSRLAIIVIAIPMSVAIGCTREAAAPPAADATTAAPVDDERLVTRVQARYQTDPAIAANQIDVSASGGTVTLRGAVHSDEARQHAQTVAAAVDGVRSVQNELQIRAAGTAAAAQPVGAASGATTGSEGTPGWITTKIQAQYFVNPEVKPWNIDVTTQSDGTVTLRGTVDEAADRAEAVRIAKETEGVTRVQDRLRVKGQPASGDTTEIDGGDAWTTAKVQAKYFLDADVKGRRIDVDTREGIVTLKGDVESEAERRQAIAIARNTEGVKSVVDQLQLRRADAAVAGDGGDRSMADGVDVDDAWITTKVQSKFFLDDQVKGRNIDVDTRNGVVTLKGTVASDAEKQAAQAIAQETDGVSKVVNQLTVDTRNR
jgi:hyperosmotically inducible protein